MIAPLTVAAALLSLSTIVIALAPLEPPDGHLLMGAWYQRTLNATPSQMNAHLSQSPLNATSSFAGLSFYQTDIDLSGSHAPDTALDVVIPMFLQQLVDTGTDAMAYITLYPYAGVGNVTDELLKEVGDAIVRLMTVGVPEGLVRGVFVRYAPEMNGNWFPYGQDPVPFIASWRYVIPYLRNHVGPDLAQHLAFIWAPNSGNGYPYPGGAFFPNGTSVSEQARLKEMDTNGDGVLTLADDPYLPFYPGDDVVDWVGLSIYHYGPQWPWITNSIPPPNAFPSLVNSSPTTPQYGISPFYTHFSSSTSGGHPPTTRGGKPFIVAETAATYHYAWSPLGLSTGRTQANPPAIMPGADRVGMKRAWWSSIMSARGDMGNIKAVCWFEFVKGEELTERDFTTLGVSPDVGADTRQDDAGVAEEESVGVAFGKDASG
ncbi:hypothetical protein HK101_004449, partial [Irineochytrium annulatum]